MSEQPNDGGRVPDAVSASLFAIRSNQEGDTNMPLRAYAAIKLCVPDSGLPWLDDMIRQAQRDKFAGQALAWAGHDNWTSSDPAALARRAYQMADAMIATREVQP